MADSKITKTQDQGGTAVRSPGRPADLRGLVLAGYYAKLYFMITAQYIKARMSYRADFWISSIGMIMVNLPSFFGILVVFQSIPQLAGWDVHELMFMYGFSLLALCPLQILFDNVWALRSKVQDGSFIKYYFRPLNMLFYYTSEVVDLKGFSLLIFGTGLVIWSSTELAIVWTLGSALGFLALLFSASLVMVGLMVAASSAAFWIVNSFSFLALFNRFRDYAKYPLTIYSNAFKFVFSAIIPIGFIAFYPVQWILRPAEAGALVFLSPIVGLSCFAIGCFVWSKGVRSWSGTGT